MIKNTDHDWQMWEWLFIVALLVVGLRKLIMLMAEQLIDGWKKK